MKQRTISEEYARLRDYNYLVFNFGSKRALPQSAKNFVDIVIVGKGLVRFIEVKKKATNDKFRGEQPKTKQYIEHCIIEIPNVKNNIGYSVIRTPDEAREEVNELIIYSMEY